MSRLDEAQNSSTPPRAIRSGSTTIRLEAWAKVVGLSFLLCSLPAFAATTITINSSVTAGAGDAYGDDEILNITASGSVDFSPEAERFGSVQGVAGSTITLGSRAIILVGNVDFGGDRFGTGFFGTLTGNSSSEVEKRSSGTLTFGTAGLGGFTGTFTITDGILALETATGVTDTVTHRFDGTGAFHKTGAGTLILGNASNSAAYLLSPHTGAINIDAGELVFDTSNGNFSLNHSTLGGVGTLGIQGGGPTKYLTLSGDWNAGTEFTGKIHIASTGHLRAGADDSLGDDNAVEIDTGGTLTLVGAEGFGSVSGGGTFDIGSNNAGVGADDADATFTGLLQGSGDLTKNGEGTWTLGGGSRNLVPLFSGFSGNLIAAEGILALNASNASFTLNHSLLGGGGTLGIAGNNSNTVTLAGDWGATTNFTGDIQIFSSGRLVAGANDSLGDGNAVQIDGGGRLTLADGEGFGSVSGSGTFDLSTFAGGVGADNASTTFDGTILGSGALTKNGTGTWTLGDADTLPSAVLGGHTGTFTIASGTVALHAATNDGTALSNAFLGSGNLQKTGAGSLTLTGLTNSFTGNYQLDEGTLVVDTTANALSIDHSNLRSGSATTLAVAGNGTNTLTLTGDWDTGDNFSGDIHILEDGRLVVGADNSLGDDNDVQIDSRGKLTLAEGEGFGALTGAGTFDLDGHDGGVSVGEDQTATFSGRITGGTGSNLTKNGLGNWILSGTTNDYSGDTTIDAGTLTLGASDVIPDTSDLTVNANGTFHLDGNSETIATLAGAGAVTLGGGDLTTGSSESTTFSGIISEAGTLTKLGTGTLTLTGANTHTGPTTISEGTLRIGSGGSLQSAITNNAELLFDRSGTLDQSAVISGTGNITKSGSGIVTLAGDNSYTGDTTVTAGTLRIGASERIADTSNLIVNGGTFDLNGFNETLDTVSGTGGTVDLGDGTLTSTNATAQYYNGNITGSGTFQKLGSGTLTLGGENTLTGTLDIDAGTLALAAGDILDGATVDLSSSATLDISAESEGFDVLTGSGFVTLGNSELILGAGDDTPEDTMTYHGVISGTGGLEKRGDGWLLLTGDNSYTGTTEITGGTLRLSGGHLSDSTTVDVSSGAFFNTFDQTTTIGGLTGSGGVHMGDGTLSSGANNTNTTYSGFLNTTANGTFAKVGTGTLKLTGLSLGLDNVCVKAGTLSIGNGSDNGLYGARTSDSFGLISMTPSNTTIAAGATLALDRSDEFQFDVSNVSGAGSFEKRGNNTIDLIGTGRQLGLFNIADGRVDILNNTSIHNDTSLHIASGASLDINNTRFTVGSISGGGTVILHEYNAGGDGPGAFIPEFTVGGNNASTVFTGIIHSLAISGTSESSEFGKFIKTGTGTLTLDTTGVEAREISISGGTLKLGTGNTFTNTQRVILNNGATLDITAEGEGFDGLSGTGGTVRMGGSNLGVGAYDSSTEWGGALNNFTDANDDTLAASPGNFVKNGSGVQTFYGDLAINFANFTGNLDIQSGTLRFNTGILTDFSIASNRFLGGDSTTLAKNGTGMMTITGDLPSFTGGFDIQEGTLNLDSDTTMSIASDKLDGAGTLQKSGTGTFTMDGGDGGFTGDIEVAGGTFKSGGGGNSLSNDTSVDLVTGATFILTGDEQFGGITGTGGTFDLAGFEGNIGYDNATDAVFSGSITSTGGGGNIIKGGTGNLTLEGTSSYTGGTTINDGTLTLGHANDTLWDNGAITINNDATLGVSYLDTVGAVTLNEGTISGSGTLTASSYAVKFGNLSANIAGSGALTKTTSGTVTLSGANSGFSGGVTVSAGTLQTGNADALGTGAVTVTGGTLDLGGNTEAVGQVTLTSGTITNGTLSSSTGFDVRSGTVSGNFAGSGGLTKSTSGTATLSGTNTYTGTTTVNDGTLLIDADHALSDSSDLVINGATFDLDNHTDTVRSLAGSGGTLDLGSGTLITSTSANTTFHGNVTGSGTLQKGGSGTLTLAGANGLTGTLDIEGGTVALGSTDNNALGGSATVNVGASGTFDVSGQDEGFGTLTGAGTVAFGNDSNRFLAVSGGSFTGTFEGAGDFRHAGSNTYTLSTANLSGFSGKLVSESGTLALDTGSGTHTLANAITGSGNLQKTGTGSLTLSGLTTAGFTGNYAIDAGTLALDTTSHDLTITHNDLSGAVGTTLEKTGTGTLTLSGDWEEGADFESAVTVSNGTLAFGAGDVLKNTAVVTLAGGATLDLSTEGENFGNLTGSGSVTLGAENIGLGYNDSASTFAGNISGTGGTLTKSGSAMLTLSGTNTYTGGTSIEAGRLRVSGGNALADNGAVTLANTEDTTLDLNNSNETIGSLSGGGSNGGNITLGTGTLTVDSSSNTTFAGIIGNVTDTGGLTKAGTGNLTLNGTSVYQGATTINGGTLTLGNATNTLRANSAISINNGATLAIGANSDTVGTITLTFGSITGSSGVLTGSSYTVKSGTVSAKLGTGTLTKSTGGTVTLSGENTLTTVNIEAGTLELAAGDILSDSATVHLTDGTLDISAESEQIGNLSGPGGTVALGSQRLTVGLNNAPSTFNGALTGTGELRKTGTSTFALGTTGIRDFTGSIDLATNGFALSSANESRDVFEGTLTGAGNLTKTGAGTLILEGNNTYTGGTILAEGTLKVGSANAINSTGTITFTGGTLQYGSANQTDYSDRFSQDANQAFSIDTNGQAVTFATSLISTGGTLTKKGSGTLTLATSNKHSGGTFLEGGTLIVGDNNALDDGSVTMAGGTTLSSNDDSRRLSNDFIINGDVSFGGSDLELAGAVDLGGGTRSLSIANSVTEIRGVISNGGLTKAGTGTLQLDGNNTYTGGTTISAGTLRISKDSAIPDTGAVTVQGGTLDLRSNATVGTVRLVSGNITGSDDTLTSNSAFNVESGTISANLAGTAALTKTTTGVVTLFGTNNTYSGDTLVQAGVLRLGAAGALSPNTTLNVSPGARFEANGHAAAFARLTGTGDIDVGSGGLTVSPSSGTNTFAGALIGVGGLIKNGAGTLELSGTHTFTGETRIDAGRLRLNGSAASSAFRVNSGGILSGSGTLGSLTISSGGTLAPGNSPGTLQASDTIWEGGGAFEFEINNAAGIVSTNWDLLAITGSLTIDATSGTPFNFNLNTLTEANVAGAMDDFDANSNYTWTFLTTTTGIGFGENASIAASFAIDTTNFVNPTNGTFAIALANAGHDLTLTYTTSAVPEPTSFAALLGLVGLTLATTRRRRVTAATRVPLRSS